MVLNLKIPAIRRGRGGGRGASFENSRTDDLSSSMATRPQEVSLNLANVKFFSLCNIFRFNLSSLLSGFARRGRGEGGEEGREKNKKERYIYIQKRKRTPRIINAYDQSTITSYFPRYRRSNQFCTVAEKQSTSQNPLPPEVLSLAVYSRREHSTCMSQVILQDSIQSRSCLNPSPNRRRRKRKEKKREGRNTVVAARASSPPFFPNFPFFVPPFPRSLDVFPRSQELSFFFLLSFSTPF